MLASSTRPGYSSATGTLNLSPIDRISVTIAPPPTATTTDGTDPCGSAPLNDHLDITSECGPADTGAVRCSTSPKRTGKRGESAGCPLGYREETDLMTGSARMPASSLERSSDGSSSSSKAERTSMCDAIRISYTYTVADVRRRPRNTVIGVVATFILVFFSGLIILGIWKAPYVLLRLAELSAGEMDVVLYGGNSTPLIDFPEMNERTLRSPDVHGSAPRWIIRAQLRSQDAIDAHRSRNSTVNASVVPSTASNVIVVDSLHEHRVGIDRGWPYRFIGYSEAQVDDSAAKYIGVEGNRGDRISLGLDLSTVAGALGLSQNSLHLPVSKPTNVTDPLSFYLYAFFTLNNITTDSVDVLDVVSGAVGATMVDAIEGAYGKYSSIFGNVVLLDVRRLARSVMDQSCLLGPQTIQPSSGFYFPTFADLIGIDADGIVDVNLQKYAMLMVTMLEDRYTMYYSETGKRNRLMTEKTNSLMEAAGLEFDGNIEYPIATVMETFDSFRILLVSSFIMVVVCVVFLGGLLMFTLLRINADERQFELAMIRAQGMPQRQVIGILLAQTLAFAIPGTMIGVLFVFAANAVFEAALKGFTHAPARLTDLPAAVGAVCAALGMVVPLLATWPPVRAALQGSLRDALDVYRQAQNESRVVMQKLEEMGLATWQVILGFFLLIAGFMVYYCMPLAFIFEDMMLFFVLLEIILIIMIVGLCMMLYVAEPFAESVVLFLLLWGRERKLKALVTKNLHSHRERNSKAYMMFLLSIGCLTAAGVMFAVLSTISSQIAALTAGAPVTVTSSSFSNPLVQAELDAFLEGEGARYIKGYAYSSFPLSNYPQISGSTTVGNLIGFARSIGVTAISRNFMDAVYPEYNIVGDYNNKYSYERSAFGKRDVVRSMYDKAPVVDVDGNMVQERVIVTGLPSDFPTPNVTAKAHYTIPMLVSSAIKDQVGVTINTGATLSYNYILKDQSIVRTQFFVEPRALMDRVSGFFAISSLPVLFRSGSILIPDTYFRQLLNPIDLDFANPDRVSLRDGAVTEVRQRTLYVQFKEKTSKSTRERFVNALQAHTDTLFHTTVDTQSVLDELKAIQNLIMYFFYFTAVVCIILCAFMLWVTFISNVQLNAWSFGVLRSIGFRNAQLIRGSVYEALCVVLSAFVLGLAAGVVIGVTLAAQFSGYLVLPFKFVLPYPLIIIMAGLAILSAFIGPVLPFIGLRRQSIAGILRGL